MSAKSDLKKYLKKIFKDTERTLKEGVEFFKKDANELGEWIEGNHTFTIQEAIKVGKFTDTDPAELIYLQKAVEKEEIEGKKVTSKIKKAFERAPKVEETATSKASGHSHSPAVSHGRPSERSYTR